MPAFYNTKKRGIQKAWDNLVEASKLDTNLSIYSAMGILAGNGIQTHSWCMMD
jgi:hypothetical protein